MPQPEPTVERRRIVVHGIVQGVGFRPFVHGQTLRLGLGGFVLNDSAGVTIEVEGQRASVDEFERALREAPPPLARGDAVIAEPLPLRGETTFAIAHSQAGPAPHADRARHRHVRRLPARAVRPGRPALPLPVHQLHQLRPALHDRPGRAVRPRQDDHAGVPDVPGLPRRVRRPARPALPRAAERMPRLRTGRALRDRARQGDQETRSDSR